MSATIPFPQEKASVPANEKPLSTLQRSFQNDPEGFLGRLQLRAEQLYACGYEVALSEKEDDPYSFLMRSSGEGSEYEVNPVQRTCTCPFFVRQARGEKLGETDVLIPCKHLQGLEKLIRAQFCAYRTQKRFGEAYALTAHWFEALAAIHRRSAARYKEGSDQADQLEQASELNAQSALQKGNACNPDNPQEERLERRERR